MNNLPDSGFTTTVEPAQNYEGKLNLASERDSSLKSALCCLMKEMEL